MQVPQQRYVPSGRPFPESLPPVEYAAGLTVRKVQQHGRFSFQGREFRVSKAFRGYPVALAPTATDGIWSIWFSTQQIGQLDLQAPNASSKRVTDVLIQAVTDVPTLYIPKGEE